MKLFYILIASSIWIPASVKCKEESFTSCPAWCCLKRHGQNAALRGNGLQSFSFFVGARFHPKYSHFPYLQTKKCALAKSRAVGQVLGCSVDDPSSVSNLDSWRHYCSLPSTPSMWWRAAIPLHGEGATAPFLSCYRSGGYGHSAGWMPADCPWSLLVSGGDAGWAAKHSIVLHCGGFLQQRPQAVSVLCARSLNKGDSCFARARP